jgi:hypothetical protein
MNYWRIRWNAIINGVERANRSFDTFGTDIPFETFGYHATPKRFNAVEVGDFVFCYQTDKKRYAALSRVVLTEPGNQVGGPCIVLKKLQNFDLKERLNLMTALGSLTEQEAEALCGRAGLAWPLE